jgi:diguanylate cyclase (GGDEF)-like protein/PAS domain S-box-containing protein
MPFSDVLNEPMSSMQPRLDAGLFEGAPEALFVLRGDEIVRTNEAALALVGRDVRGRSVADVIAGWSPSGDPSSLEGMLRKNDGNELPVEVRIRRIDDETSIISVRDARELLAGRAAVTRLYEAEARYRSLVEQVPAVVYADQGDVTTYVSPQIEAILGVTPEAYMADPDMWIRLVHPDDREWVRTQSDDFIAGRGGDLDDYRIVRPDGRVVWIRDRAFAYRDEDGRVVLEQGLLFDVTELKEAEARVTHMAYHDTLTGLANRELFQESLLLAVERARRDRTAIAVLYLDLDNFKELNDTLGHHAGDLLLAGLAERLQACTRDSDLVARQGGDEFLLLLADLAPHEAETVIVGVLERVIAALEEPIDLAGTPFRAHASIGVSRFPDDARDAESLLRNADTAMYRSKRVGPGGYRFFADGD